MDDVLRSGLLAQGTGVRLLEDKIAESFGAAGAVAAGSGTAALVLALQGLELRTGGEVIAPTYVCGSVLQAIVSAGLVPVLCDVEDGWNMSAATVSTALSARTVAIVAVHIYGQPCDVHGLLDLDLPVIEDACQAWGARLRGRLVGTIGTAGIFSTHATKCLTTGEGGFACSTDSDLIARMRVLRDGAGPGSTRLPSPMTDLQAALGASQLARYPEFLERRASLAAEYMERLARCRIVLPDCMDEGSIFFRFPVRAKEPFELIQQAFARQGIAVRRGVDQLLHRARGNDPRRFPRAEALFAQTVSLPIYPALSPAEQGRIIAVCHEIWGE